MMKEDQKIDTLDRNQMAVNGAVDNPLDVSIVDINVNVQGIAKGVI